MYQVIRIRMKPKDKKCNPSTPLSNGFNRVVKDIFSDWYIISSECFSSFGWWYWRHINHGEVLFCTNQLSVNAGSPCLRKRDSVRVFNINERRSIR